MGTNFEIIEENLRSRDLETVTKYILSEIEKGKEDIEITEISNGIWSMLRENFKKKGVGEEDKKVEKQAKNELIYAFRRYLKNREFLKTVQPSHFAVQMHKLFRGHRSYFSYYQERASQKYKPAYFLGLTENEFRDHLSGYRSITCVPIDIDRSYWGAIDVDVHDEEGDPLDFLALEKKIMEKNYPLVLCKSKSERGAHLYLFCQEGVESESLRELLTKYAKGLDLSDYEIFPKQDMLRAGRCGNVLNMPYYKGEKRTCVHNGEENLSVLSFLEVAREKMQTREQINKALTPKGYEELEDAPPCLEKIIPNPELYKVSTNKRRNNTLYGVAVFYAKKFSPTGNRDRYMASCNAFLRKLKEPLRQDEIKNTTDSVWDNVSTYNYKCKDVPFKETGLCNQAECKARKYGFRAKNVQYIKHGADKEARRKEKESAFEKCFNLVTDFTIIRYVDSEKEDEYEFTYNGVKSSKRVSSEILLQVKKLNVHLYNVSPPNFPYPNQFEREGYESWWVSKRKEALKAGRIKFVAEELTDEGEVRLAIKDYIEQEETEIKELREAPENIMSKGVFYREHTLEGYVGDFFICKSSVIINILQNSDDLSQKVIKKLKKHFVFNALSKYRIMSSKINVKLSSGEKRQVRIWAIPLESGSRLIKHGVSKERSV